MKFTLELNFDVPQVDSKAIADVCAGINMEHIGAYAEVDGMHGKGAVLVGMNLVKIGGSYFDIVPAGQTWILNHVEWKESYVCASTRPIEITGLLNGDIVLFKDKEDAVEWLSTMKDRILKDLWVNDSQGKSECAFFYKLNA